MPEKKAPPLTGLKVLELSQAVMGPLAGMVLADLGAEVVKVEPPPAGEPTRRLTGQGAGIFPFYNRGKLSLLLDLKDPRGLALMEELAGAADVFIENYAPGTAQRLGLGPERLMGINPRLVYCALKGFLPGPYEDRLALDEVCQMMGGLAYMTGPQGMPLRAGASVVDVLAGAFGVIAILAALEERRRTGRGGLARAGLFEATALLMGQHLAAAAAGGPEPTPMPQRARSWGVYDLFATADGGQVFLGVTSDGQWERFCRVFGLDDLLADPRLAGNRGRLEARDWLLPRLARELGALGTARVLELAQVARLPFGPLQRPQDLWRDPHLLASGGLLEAVLPGGGAVMLPGLPIRLEGHDLGPRPHAPRPGQGAARALAWLDLAPGREEELESAGVLGRPED